MIIEMTLSVKSKIYKLILKLININQLINIKYNEY